MYFSNCRRFYKCIYFGNFSKYLSINSTNPSLVDYGTTFDTPGVSGGVQVSNEKNIFDFSLYDFDIP